MDIIYGVGAQRWERSLFSREVRRELRGRYIYIPEKEVGFQKVRIEGRRQEGAACAPTYRQELICPVWPQYNGLKGVQAGEVGWGHTEEGFGFRQGVWMLLSKQ